MTSDPYKYLWREETDADYPCHIYLTQGQWLYGWIKRGTTEVVMFSQPYKTWSPSRRKFRKLGKREIDALCMNIELKFAA